ncbi:MAG TPA: IMP cyclohydrolase [Sphaerochaeta sp.]|nr:IMP cyclohydrolase [Sphaerochaeta sp.]
MDIEELLRENTYPGRGIIVGLSPQARAVSAYFIMGRSENSRNRVLSLDKGNLNAEAFDPKQVKDPSLIHYTAFQRFADVLILSNGDHGDIICSYLKDGETFEQALGSSSYEPDEPHYTARISSLVSLKGPFTYKLSIVKKGESGCKRKFFKYNDPTKGGGHLIHTYKADGKILPSFTGSPREVTVGEDIEAFSQKIWGALNKDNRIALYVRYTDLSDGKSEERLFNTHTR